MQEKKKKNGGNEDSKKKERHIVTWTQQEDDILRQQISLHGTENWGIIASKFKDKTTRQCRRRWYTYLNSDFKKGGWSPEEDILLCKAQKIFGNRWTEIAKVVSGRTDNAVKNRFSTLCKKRAKYEALAKENKNPCMNLNNIQVIFNDGFNADSMAENEAPIKKMRRSNVPDSSENCYYGNRSHLRSRNQQPRTPFAVLAQDIHNDNMTVKNCVSASKEIAVDASENRKTRGMFLKKDDPKITALMQQAELLSSLALKVNTENTDQSLENAWEIVQDYLNQSKESDFPGHKISDFDFQFEDFKDLIEDLRSCSNGCLSSWRQPDLYKESPTSTEYSTGSTRTPYKAPDKTEHTQAEIPARQEDVGIKSQSIHTEERIHVGECEKEITSNEHITKAEILPSCEEQINNVTVISASSSTEFGSPRQVIPLFRSLAAGIPSPKFSESERKFLLKTLGVESPSPNPSSNSSQQPSCKRALLQSL